MAVESEVIDRLARRDVRLERAAYAAMLEQVPWTALGPREVSGVAAAWSRRLRRPVEPEEALRALRRSLHAVLRDERVLDVVEALMLRKSGSGDEPAS